MKRFFLAIIIAALAFPFQSEAKRPKPKAEYVVFIAIDGWATQSFKDKVDNMPTVKYLMENGCYTFHKRSTMPSASAINWATIFMGVPTEMHGYYKWNSSKPDIEAYALSDHGMPVTVYTLLSDQRPDRKSACIYNWDGIGPVVDTLSVDYHLYDPGYHDKGGGYTLEKYTRNRAVKCIKEMRPNFFTFYIGDVDEAGHKYGWESEEYQKCLKETDEAIAIIIQALKDEGIYEKSIIVIGSDHGGKGKGHGGFTLEEMETPFVIFGKNVAKKGEMGFMMQYDLSATLAEALGLKIPEEWRGNSMPVFK